MERLWVAVLIASLLAFQAAAPLSAGGEDAEIAGQEVRAIASDAAQANASAPLVLVWAVLPDAYNSSETVVLRNCGEAGADLAGWSVTDLEGTLTFGGRTLAPGEELVICQSAYDYEDLAGCAPDFTYKSGWSSTLGTFRLANDADEVLLLEPGGGVADAFIYGKSVYDGAGWEGSPVPKRSKGELHCRGLPRVLSGGTADASWSDTDTASDWSSPIKRTLGASEHPAADLHADGATLFLSPDCSLEVMTEALRSATRSIDVHVYELASVAIVRELANATLRGVRVRALIEGEVVSGISDACEAAAWALVQSGAEVRQVTSQNDVWGHRRYEFVHCKYVVIDNASFVMMSENLKQSGFPIAGQVSNRGWGAWVMSAGGAGYLHAVFDGDWSAPESVAYAGVEGELEDETGDAWTRKAVPPSTIGPFDFTLAVTPDCTLRTDPIIDVIESAEETLYIQQFYIYTHWGTKYDTVESDPNPYLEAVTDAARRGVEVKVILDATDYNVDPADKRDNDDTVRYLNGIAKTESLDMEARLISPLHGFSKVHNKGIVADGDTALVSSINWNENSPCANRESALVIRSEGAGYFEAAFLRDWADDLAPPKANITCQAAASAGVWVALSGALSTDDAGIVNYSWCVDGDGLAEAWGMETGWIFTTSGTKTVTLTVRDLGGNETSASAAIEVEGGGLASSISPWWLLAAVVAIVVAGGAFLLLRR